jgi:hypothetical protein
MSLGLPKGQTTTVMRVSGITGAHAAANGDYYEVTDPEAPGTWVQNGVVREAGETPAGYSFTFIDTVTGAFWILQLGALNPAIVQQTADDDTVANPAAVAAWGTGPWVATVATGADTIAVASATAAVVPMSVEVIQETNIESPGAPGTNTAEVTLSPGAPGTNTAEVTLSPGAPGANTAEVTLSPGAPGTNTAEVTLSPGAPGTNTAEVSLSPGAPGANTAEVTLSPGAPGALIPEV